MARPSARRCGSARNGEHVGTDAQGNMYYRSKKKSPDGRERRWVIYDGPNDASRVPAEWHGWLHGSFDGVPESFLPPARIWETEFCAQCNGHPWGIPAEGRLGAGRHPRPGDRRLRSLVAGQLRPSRTKRAAVLIALAWLAGCGEDQPGKQAPRPAATATVAVAPRAGPALNGKVTPQQGPRRHAGPAEQAQQPDPGHRAEGRRKAPGRQSRRQP